MTPTQRVNIGKLFWVIGQFQAATSHDVTTTIGPDLQKVTCTIFDSASQSRQTQKFPTALAATVFFEEHI